MSKDLSRNSGSKPWSFRRKIVVSTLLFDAIVIIVCILKTGIAPSVAEVAISSAFFSGGAIIGSYVFGAVWHDKKGQP